MDTIISQNRFPFSPHQHIPHAPVYLLEKKFRARLIAEGLQEFMTCDLISPAQAAMTLEHSMNKEALISVLHSHSVDQSVLRTSLLPGLVADRQIQYRSWDVQISQDSRLAESHFKEKEQYIEPTACRDCLERQTCALSLGSQTRRFRFLRSKRDH